MVKDANRPGPPEDSVTFRVTCTAAVSIAIAAAWAEGELPAWIGAASIVAVVVGNVISHRRRNRPVPWLKLALAVVVVIAFTWFISDVTSKAKAGNISSVEAPLALLFVWIQVTHAFDVPSRRDLAFSLAGSATLMAVAAAQAVSSTFSVFVVAWAAVALVALMSMWASMIGGSRVKVRTAVVSASLVLVVGLGIVALLPAPHPSSTIIFPSALAGNAQTNSNGTLLGGGAAGAEPAKPGSPSGATRVGGYLGFAGPLDTGIRGPLGNQVVMHVRADRPSYWIAETFNYWNGESWISTPPPHNQASYQAIDVGPPFAVPLPANETSTGTPDIQTFYMAVAGPNLIFHAANAAEVWFPSSKIFVAPNGTIKAGASMGSGSIYTVESLVNQPSVTQLETAGPNPFPGHSLTRSDQARYTQLPHPYPRVKALTEKITANAPTVYQKVLALEAWMGANTRYTTNIPALGPGQDTVTQFLFGSRRGYCEQISTSLAVMLRSIGIPAREATGYVPGSFNPITDLYKVEAKDAHAWVQVWFPGYGWQSFDPTADVPLANPTPAGALVHSLVGGLRHIPLLPTIVVLALAALLWALRRWRTHTPLTWAEKVSREVLRAAERAGLEPRKHEATVVVAARLDAARLNAARVDATSSGRSDATRWEEARSVLAIALLAERAAYGRDEPDPRQQKELLAAIRRVRRTARRLRRRSRAGNREDRRTAASPGDSSRGGSNPGDLGSISSRGASRRETTPRRRAGV